MWNSNAEPAVDIKITLPSGASGSIQLRMDFQSSFEKLANFIQLATENLKATLVTK